MASYLDTSFLIKPYVFERESQEVAAWLPQNRGQIFISALSDIEIVTSLHRGFESSLPLAMQAIDAYRNDFAQGIYKRLAIDANVFSRAERVAEVYSRRYKLRSLDILHLATALRHGMDSFCSYDKRQRDAARALGFTVLPHGS